MINDGDFGNTSGDIGARSVEHRREFGGAGQQAGGIRASRRDVLSALAGSLVIASCAADKSTTTASTTTASSKSTQSTKVPTRSNVPDGIFALGVASGDPLSDRVILWTRLASKPLDADAGAPDGDVEVRIEVARDSKFTDLILDTNTTAKADFGHSVHLDATDLEPATAYFYRFSVGDQVSPIGRTRTLPKASADVQTFRFAYASCQDIQWGNFSVWAHVADEPDLDAVVFLGDYIYEMNLGDASPKRNGERLWKAPVPTTLDHYRWRYAQTKADPLLQRAHAAAPWICTFDDHEVANNYAGDVDPLDPDNGRQRRIAAYQAWYENTPIRLTPPPTSFDELTVNRRFDIGKLVRMSILETRQFADTPPCRTSAADGTRSNVLTDEGPGCAERDDPTRTNLGADQESWLIESLTASDAKWNIIANPVMFATVNLGTADKPVYTLDTWDGYPAVRERIIRAIVDHDVPNPVVVTGDWHAGFVNDVEDPTTNTAAMPEFVATSVTTLNFPKDPTAANPHIKYFEGQGHGYGLVTVTADRCRCDLKYVADVWDPASAISRVDSFEVNTGEHTARRI